MPIKYKINILEALKAKGYTTYKIKQEKLLSESTLQKFRNGDVTITLENLATLCRLLECQPSDIIEYINE